MMMVVAAGLCLRLGWLQIAHVSALRSRIEPPRKRVQEVRLFPGMRRSRIFQLASDFRGDLFELGRIRLRQIL